MKHANPFIAGHLVRPLNFPQPMTPKGMIELDPVARARPSEWIRPAVFLYLPIEKVELTSNERC